MRRRRSTSSTSMPCRRDVDAIDAHMLISAFCIFRLANRHTLRAIFGRVLTDKRLRKHYRQMLGDLLRRTFTSTPGEPAVAPPRMQRSSRALR